MALVDKLPDDSGTDSEALEILWAGQDAGIRYGICNKLDAAGVFHQEDSTESRFMPAFRQSIYRIQIRKRDHEAALSAAHDVYTGDDSYARLSPGFVLDRNSDLLNATVAKEHIWDRVTSKNSALSEPDSDTEVAEDFAEFNLEDFNPDEATHQVWSGADSDLKEMIVASLRGIGIGCVADEANGNFTLRVEPAAEARAKEIVREIVEQTPPGS